MTQPQDLQVALRERFKRLLTARHNTYVHEVKLVRDWVNAQGMLAAIIDEIAGADPDVDADAWIQQVAGYGAQFFWASATEEGRARLAWAMLNYMAEREQAPAIAFIASRNRNFNEGLRETTQIVIEPLFDYLTERVGKDSGVLYALQRWIRRLEWFDRDALYEKFESNTQQGEAVYDRNLRRFLFDQGFDMPVSQARSASGESDLLGELHTDDPLVCEVKLFDGQAHPIRNIAKGVNQSLQYALDHSKPTAYLVVVNLSRRPITFPTDGPPDQRPPYVDLDGVRIYLLAVRAAPMPSASKQPKASPTIIKRAQLVDPDGQ